MAPPMLLGLQMSTVCNLEFSIYFGHQPCPVIPDLIGGSGGLPDSPTCWLVQAVPAQTLWTNGNNCLDLGGPFNAFSLAKVGFWPELSSHDFLLNEKVRATSFILLLGVGSFVCYRIFHHLRGRIGKRKHPTNNSGKKSSRKRGLEYDFCAADFSDDSSDLSSVSDLSAISDTTCPDRESTSGESYSFSDGNERLEMGLTSSNPYEPVFYTKNNGVSFIRSQPGQPRDIVNKDVARLRPARKRQLLSSGDWASGVNDDKENDFENSINTETDPFTDSIGGVSYEYDPGLNSFQSQDAMSMKGNFSPGSLHERVLRTEELMSRNDSISSNSRLTRHSSLRLASRPSLKREYSADSFSCRSESRGGDWSASRTISIDSQVSELAPELQQEAQEIGCVAVERIENLETELNDLKQTVIDLDAEFVNLKVYKRPPERCWELTNISLSDTQSPLSENRKDSNDKSSTTSSRILDVVEHHKTKMWYKGLLDNKQLERVSRPNDDNEGNDEIRWDLVSQRLLDWDVEEEDNAVDSGSDFGNSLETDSVEFEESSSAAVPISLEWDAEDGVTGGTSEVDNAAISIRNNTTTASFNNNVGKTSSEGSASSDSNKRKVYQRRRTLTRKSSSSDNSASASFRTRSASSHCASNNVLAEQIVKAIGIGNPDCSVTTSHSSSQGANNPDSVSMIECLREEEDEHYPVIHEARNVDDNGNNEDYRNETGSNIKNEFRDSAYYDGSDFPDTIRSSNEYFEDPVTLSSLIASSSCSELTAKGLDVLAKNLEVKLARKVQNDHYCSIRATVFHLLSKGHSLLRSHGNGATSLYQILTSAAHGSAPWLLRWSFGSKLPYAGESCLKGFWECLKSLEELEESLKNANDKEDFIITALKNTEDLDAKLNEAAKLSMVVSSLKLYDILRDNNLIVNGDNGEVRMFSMLLYGRESSRTPEELVMNNIDKIGNTVSLDHIGLNLLGLSLNATIKVARPHLYDTREFIQACPDWMSNVWPEVLLATDDQNVWLLKR